MQLFTRLLPGTNWPKHARNTLKKGDHIFIEGRIFLRFYEANGNKCKDFGITAEKIVFISPLSKGFKKTEDKPQQPDLVIDMDDTEAVNKIFKDDETIPF